MITVLAHTEERHTNTLTATVHATSPYVQVLIFVSFMILVGYAIDRSTRSLETTLSGVCFLLLVSGFSLNNLSPIVSVLSLTVGLLLLLFLVLGSQLKNDK